jgi:hypothetical protein
MNQKRILKHMDPDTDDFAEARQEMRDTCLFSKPIDVTGNDKASKSKWNKSSKKKHAHFAPTEKLDLEQALLDKAQFLGNNLVQRKD